MSLIRKFFLLCVLGCATILTDGAEPIACPWDPNQTPGSGKVSYVNAQLWKALIDTDEKRTAVTFWEQSLLLQDFGINEGDRTDIFVESKYVEEMKQRFSEKGIDIIVHQSNFQQWIDEENPPLTKVPGPYQLTWIRYHRLEDIYSYMRYLSEYFKDICSVDSIGKSIEGRNINVIKISNGKPNNKAVWLDGGIHAREWISPATVTYVINHIVTNWKKSPDLNKIDWHIVPVLNPDGYEFSHTHDRLWRKNRRVNGSCYGTDLNRNFKYAWGEPGSSSCPCHDVYSGTHAFSEPEAEAVRKYFVHTHKHTNWKSFFTFHSFDQVIYYSGDDVKELADNIATKMHSVNGTTYVPVPTANDPTVGGSDEWAKRILGIKYSGNIELRDTGYRGFILPYWNIIPSGEEAVAAIKEVAKTVNAS